jgi:ELWxxDGT repeat protein
MARDRVKNFLKRARRAKGIEDGRFKFNDAIGDGDNDDLYRIQLRNRSSFKGVIKRLSDPVNVELYTFDRPRKEVLNSIGQTPFSDLTRRDIRKNLNRVFRTKGSGKIRIREELEADDYYLRITPRRGNADTNYRVVMRSQSLPDDTPTTDPGGTDSGSTPPIDDTNGGGGTTLPADNNNSRAAAQSLAVDFKERTYDNNNLPSGFAQKTFYLGSGDTEDYFTFDLQTASTFNLDLTGLNGASLGTDIDVQVLDNLGIPVSGATSNNFGSSAESISQSLNAGTYFIRVYTASSVGESDYALKLSALPADVDPNGAGDTPGDAATLNLSSPPSQIQTFNDFVGGADSNDYYRLDIPAGGGFIGIDLDEIEDDDIDGRTSNIDLQIIPSTSLDGDGNLIPGATVTTSSRGGDNNEEVAGIFEEGTYYIRVYPNSVDDGAFYRMNLQAYSVLDIPAIVSDLNPGTSSSLTGTTLVGDPTGNGGNGILYFFADDGSGNSLWQTEGTLETTSKINTPSTLEGFDNLINVDGDIFFTAFDSASGTGRELYVYNGSSISLVQDINPGASSGIDSNSQFFVADGKLYFTANDGTFGNELWVTEGTSATTTRLTDIAASSASSDASRFVFASNGNNKALYFTATNEGFNESVYQYNIVSDTVTQIGTGTNELESDSLPNNLTLANGNLYFNADGGASVSNSLWVIENAASSTTLTQVAASSAFGGGDAVGYAEFTAFNGTLYFVADDGTDNTNAIWRVTSGNAGVERVAKLGGTDSLNAEQLTVLSNGASETLYFVGDTTSEGKQLWAISDANVGTANLTLGSNTGSYEVTSNLRSVDNLTVVGSGTPTLYFTASQLDTVLIDGNPQEIDVTGSELFKVDGALSGISSPFANIRPDDPNAKDSGGNSTPIVLSSNPSNLVEVGGRLYFKANNNSEDSEGNAIGAGEELWVLGIEA